MWSRASAASNVLSKHTMSCSDISTEKRCGKKTIQIRRMTPKNTMMVSVVRKIVTAAQHCNLNYFQMLTSSFGFQEADCSSLPVSCILALNSQTSRLPAEGSVHYTVHTNGCSRNTEHLLNEQVQIIIEKKMIQQIDFKSMLIELHFLWLKHTAICEPALESKQVQNYIDILWNKESFIWL